MTWHDVQPDMTRFKVKKLHLESAKRYVFRFLQVRMDFG